MKKANEEERDALMRSPYVDPIEHFPKKMDQLLDALHRVCFIFITSYAYFFADLF